jgi:hypothetical protein
VGRRARAAAAQVCRGVVAAVRPAAGPKVVRGPADYHMMHKWGVEELAAGLPLRAAQQDLEDGSESSQ